MTFLLRTARENDLEALYRMAKGTGGGFTNLPPDRGTLEAKLERAAACFAKAEPDHGRGWHLRLEGRRLTALAAFPSGEVLEFTAEQFGLPSFG